ncbi:hypothetical protein ACSNOI_42485 [Actinomadura kijaniata]|uniref:hypothetical protein n=1 Tax=Actinomadura kijaniata TaxID=46161 RepID=UPI003F1C3134
MNISLPRRTALTAAIAVSAALPLTAAVQGTASAAPLQSAAARPGKAVNLKVTPTVRRALGDTFFKTYKRHHPRAKRSHVVGPKGVYYGKVVGRSSATTVYYAVGEIRVKGDPISGQDGPHIWRKNGRGAWRYLGDSGGSVCHAVPRVMLRAWHKKCDWYG